MDVLGLDERRVGNRCGNVGGHPGRGIYVGGRGGGVEKDTFSGAI